MNISSPKCLCRSIDTVSSTTTNTDDVIDSNIFKNIDPEDHCDGDTHKECNALKRTISALEYHQFVVNTALNEKYAGDAKRAFVAFCRDIYTKQCLLDDYIHFIEHHADTKSLEDIRGRLRFKCGNAKKCGATGRHYRDRRNDSNNGDDGNDEESKWFIDRIDGIHFMVHHLIELGMRVQMDALQNEVKHDDDDENMVNAVDFALQRMGQEIESKRQQLSSDRLDDSANSKFTIKVDEVKENDGMYQNAVYDQKLET